MSPADKERFEKLLTELTHTVAETRTAVNELRGSQRKHGNGSPKGWTAWVLGVVAILLTAGVIANVQAANTVSSIKTDLGLLRAEVGREFGRFDRSIQALDTRLGNHLMSPTSGNGGGG